MVQTTLSVCMGGQGLEVGQLMFEAQGNRQFSRFQYANAWLENPRSFALAPSMPLRDAPFFYRPDGDRGSPLPPPLADTTPDSWGRNIIRRDARETREDTRPLNECDFLTAVDDFSRMGALRLRSPDGGDFLASLPGGLHDIPPLLQLNELGRTIASLEQQEPMTAKALQRLRQVGSALGGARPKCSVLDGDQLFIAKFTSRLDTQSVELVEVLTLQLAQLCGLRAPAVRLDQSDGLAVALIQRFDRSANGRIPYISAQTMLDRDDANGGAYTELAEAIRAHSDAPGRDLLELFKRIAFTILVSNTDDHLKNHGFLYAGNNQWRLSPLFDVNPSPDRHRELKTAISEISGTTASIATLLEHAPFFDVPTAEAAAILKSMATTIRQSWRGMGQKLGMARQDFDVYVSAFEHEDTDVAQKL
jgi:serine/threonine-protein kinase HipA